MDLAPAEAMGVEPMVLDYATSRPEATGAISRKPPIHAFPMFPHAPARLKKAAPAAKLAALFETLGSSETLGAGAFGDRPDSGA